jgi:ArsR family transcriptional regulator
LATKELAPEPLPGYSYFVDKRMRRAMSAVRLRAEKSVSADTAQEQIAKIAKALGHPARIQIIETLLRRTTCIGCDIVEEIGLAASTTSEHLRILKEAGLITGEIEHPRVCYSLNPVGLAPLGVFIDRAMTTRLVPIPNRRG